MRRPSILLVATVCSVAIASDFELAPRASADFVRFEADNYPATAGGNGYQVIDVYAVFTAAGDRVLNCFDVDLALAGAGTTNFYQASIPGTWPASGLPALVILDANAFAYDTFITIGCPQGELTCGTNGDPSYDDATFVATGVIGAPAGWYNLPPANGWGDAGGDLKVLLGRFTIEDNYAQPGARIGWSATVGYISGGITKYATEARTFYFPPVPVTADPAPEDFDGDGKGDIVWQAPSSNTARFWKIDGTTLVSSTTLSATIPGSWTAQGSGDFDGDGDPDLLFRTSSGDFIIQFVQAGNTTTTETIVTGVAAAWQCVAIGDLDGDGRHDLVLRNTTTNEVRGWLMDAQYRWKSGSIGSGGSLLFVTGCDLDGNGTMDLVWRTTAGQVQGWLLDGLSITASGAIASSGLVPSNWSVVSNGDLNGDGNDDLVWRNSINGNVNGWLMQGLAKAGGGLLSPNVDAAWQPTASLDLDGDGDDDLVWRNTTTGAVNGWIMQGLTKVGGGTIGIVPPLWVSLTR